MKLNWLFTGNGKDAAYLAPLDGIRFLSIVMVMYAHWTQWALPETHWGKMIPGGWGVLLFFVISGYLITRNLMDARRGAESTGGSKGRVIWVFYLRRFLRIFPLYYVTILILYRLDVAQTRAYIDSLLTYTFNIPMSMTDADPGSIMHFWSLCVEEQFYLFWPWLIVFIPWKWLGPMFWTVLFASAGFMIWFTYGPFSWRMGMYHTLPNLFFLAIGALVALDGFRKHTVIRWMRWWPLLALNTVLFLLVQAYAMHELLQGKDNIFFIRVIADRLWMGLVVALWISNVAEGEMLPFMRRLMTFKPFAHWGKISYCLYVIHPFMQSCMWMLHGVGLFTLGHSLWSWFLWGFLLTWVVSEASWRIMEEPLNSLKRFFPYVKKKMSPQEEPASTQ